MLTLVQDIKDYWQKKPTGSVLVGTSGYWPLPYYLREKPSQAGYFVPQDPGQYLEQYDIIMVDTSVNWHGPGWPRKFYRLSDVTEAFVYFKPIL